MNTKRTINIKNLFAAVLILKITSSFLAWQFNDPWILGFGLPITFMLAYILIGIRSDKPGISDDKFADSCYYLGFIFTITSIIFSLFDIPNIGDNINNIAIRFGAAMVSTVLGLAVRVYLVTFKMKLNDAIHISESILIASHQKFTEQLIITVEHMQAFQEKVDSATQKTVERVNVQLEQLSKNHAEKLTEFFIDLSEKNQTSFTEALNEVKKATVRLSDSVETYSSGMGSNISSIEEKITAFTNAVSNRLKTTTFPDDFFANKLSLPLEELINGASNMSESIKHVVREVDDSAVKIATTLNKINTHSDDTLSFIDAITKMNSSHQTTLDYSQTQLITLEKINKSLSELDASISIIADKHTDSNQSIINVVNKIENLSQNKQNTLQELNVTLNKFLVMLSQNKERTTELKNKTDEFIKHNNMNKLSN
jgi:hypothetical protein